MSDTSAMGERIEAMQTLMSEVLNIQQSGDHSEEAVKRVRDIIESSDRILDQVEETHEKMIDSKIITVGSKVVCSHVQAFDTNLMSFSPEDYTAGIVSYLEGKSLGSELNWDLLASETCSKFRKVPPLFYMRGTFEIDPPPPPEKIRPERQKKPQIAEKSVVATVVQGDESNELSDVIYQHILKCLVIKYKANNKEPLNYLEFITDPDDYWRTVENIFHFSFLVRDNKVKMSLNDEGIPVVEPKSANTSSDRQAKIFQFNFRISKFEWREIIETFNVVKASIIPLRR